MKLKEAFATLKSHFKNHSAAAYALGFTKDHYRAMRNGRANIPQKTANYIIAMAKQCEGAGEAAQTAEASLSV